MFFIMDYLNKCKPNNDLYKISDFSIEHILNRAGDKYDHHHHRHRHHENDDFIDDDCSSVEYCDRFNFSGFNLQSTSSSIQQLPQQQQSPQILNWLQYTRYRPPKIQRPFRNGPLKRTPGRLPRVPFSPQQLNALEEAYTISNYLSSEMANKLADQLHLTNTRIKIWFQNRRARERREKRERGESPDLLIPSSSSPAAQHLLTKTE